MKMQNSVAVAKVWTEDEIRNLLLTNDIMLMRSLMKLYDLQTQDEQEQGRTKHLNGVGFNGADSRFMSSVAQFLIRRNFLTNKQIACVRRRIMKYTGQITRIANNQI